MNKGEFLELLKEKAAAAASAGAYQLGDADLEAAVNLIGEMAGDDFYMSQIGKAINVAKRLKIEGSKKREDKPPGIGHGFTQKLTQQDLITSDYLLKQVAPSVEQARKELFGSTAPPFDSIKAAVSWIKKKAAEPLPPDVKAKKERGHHEYKRLADMVAKDEAVGQFGIHRSSLDFPGDGIVESIPVTDQTDLARLSGYVRRISSATGFPEYFVTTHILTGIEPIVPRVKVSCRPSWHELPAGNSLWRKKFVIEINAADLSFEELRNIYSAYRNGLNISRKKPPSKDQVKLYNLVKDKGWPPEDRKGTVAFWKSVQGAWNDIPGTKKYKSWEGVYQRYKIIEDKFNNLFNEPPGKSYFKK